MAEKERIGRAQAKSLLINKIPISPVVGGVASITGSGTVTAPLNTITSVVATLGADAALTGHVVTATFSGLTITLKVWKPTASGDCTPVAATAAKTVYWLAIGS